MKRHQRHLKKVQREIIARIKVRLLQELLSGLDTDNELLTEQIEELKEWRLMALWQNDNFEEMFRLELATE